ncbi:hypothetical protein K457DRAFT_864057 [Linnemannia elongata AG-77]|uniref:BHLH domain-containing protein n=1 Tax=Linnemannia elongata AG-77 TaxID=1314771 RepID=A0A197K7T3_9FUNG|nr:hypothetical protein K457DRAFT_864057 [Linnemannia elongata AG-77]
MSNRVIISSFSCRLSPFASLSWPFCRFSSIVERRRRDNINEKIQELSTLLNRSTIFATSNNWSPTRRVGIRNWKLSFKESPCRMVALVAVMVFRAHQGLSSKVSG